MYHCKRIESLEIDPTNIVNWSLTKEQKQCDGEKTVFSTNSSETTGYIHTQKNINRFYNLQKNSELIIVLNVKHKIVKLLEENRKSRWLWVWWLFRYNTKDTIHERKLVSLTSLKLKTL